MLGLLLALGLTSCHKDPAPARILGVDAVLPLSGPLSPAGKAFADGLSEGFKGMDSDTLKYVLTLLDNASSADSATQLLLQPRQELLVAGIGAAATELPPRKNGLALWVGQEGEPPVGWVSLAASAQEQADSLLAWCRKAPRPLAIVFAATAQWAPLVQERLMPKLDSVILIPHDGGEAIWNREATRILVSRPASILLWHAPEQARSFLSRKDLDSLLSKAKVLGPEGAGTARAWGPVWEPSTTGDTEEIARWKQRGHQAALRLGGRGKPGGAGLPLVIHDMPSR